MWNNCCISGLRYLLGCFYALIARVGTQQFGLNTEKKICRMRFFYYFSKMFLVGVLFVKRL